MTEGKKLLGIQREKQRLEKYNIHDLEREKKTAHIKKTSGEMGFVSLHHHTTFSYLDGFGTPEQHVQRAAELGMHSLAVTEHGNMSSHPQFERAAIAAGIKPIFGCEFYCGGITEKTKTKRKNHLTVLASDQTGYLNLLRLIERSYSEGFYYEPTVSGSVLAEHSEGLFVLSGCLGSLFATSIVGGKNISEGDASFDRGLDVARKFRRTFGDRYFIEVQPFPELPKTVAVNQAAEAISRKTGIPLVVTGDVHYMTKDENEMQAILHNIRGGAKQTLEQQEAAWGYDIHLCTPEGEKLLYKRLRATGLSKSAAREAIANTLEIAAECNVTLPKSPKLRFPTPEGVDSVELWREWLREGWKFRGFNRLKGKKRQEYIRRIKHEMKVVEDKEFVDYFLIVSDAVRWAKDHGIVVGPARGSAAGSLACYLLRITEVNPMDFPMLMFERFVDPFRVDEPDIDLDFDDERRSEVRDYLVQKYGAEHVANLGTFTYFKSKGTLDDLARVYRIPQWDVDKIKGLLIQRSGGDLRADATIEDTIEMFDEVREVFDTYPDLYKATDLEGNIKTMGIHAAGLVLSNQDMPIRDLVPIHRRENKKTGEMVEVAAIDKYDAELMGLMKMDFLSVRTMGLLGIALDELGMELDDLYRIPLDDPETIQGFVENDVVGIFQFDGQATKDVAGILRPNSFNDAAHINALSRPGPLHNGATATYINIKQGLEKPPKLHPIYDEITKTTMGQLVYQEQILKVVQQIGGFDWTHVSHIRRLISKKRGEQEFNRQKKMFMDGALENGVKKEVAEKIWRMCITAGAYAFNAAHAVSYGMNAWYTMWLKRHHPQVFFMAALRKYPAKQKKLLKDAVDHGLKILPPHPRKSSVTWKASGKKGIRAGFAEIPGIGEKMAAKIIEYGPKSWSDMINVSGIGPKKLEMMQEFVQKDDPFDVHRLSRVLGSVREALDEGEIQGLPAPTHTAFDIPYEATTEDIPVVWCGVALERNLRDLFEYHLSKKGEELDPTSVKRPDLREWVVMKCEDEEEIVYVTFDRYNYPKWKNSVWGLTLNTDIVLVRGVKRGFLNKRDILVKEFWVLEED